MRRLLPSANVLAHRVGGERVSAAWSNTSVHHSKNQSQQCPHEHPQDAIKDIEWRRRSSRPFALTGPQPKMQTALFLAWPAQPPHQTFVLHGISNFSRRMSLNLLFTWHLSTTSTHCPPNLRQRKRIRSPTDPSARPSVRPSRAGMRGTQLLASLAGAVRAAGRT
ncbi:hypothetical protein IWZ00DRAFT_241964 [Phyllosticta capitalensis]|uniref:Uncharacterized protein n=1 Tax=Phyllosticta capitalensis TaxID=121624 RepID=A0ABR1YWE5_9PEZI